jgi:hypothetical protein
MSAIRDLHERTAESVTVDARILEQWIDRPAAVVAPLLTGSAARANALGRLQRELWLGLAGRSMRAGWIHGDFVPENVLVDPHDGDRVTGIIDWELAASPELPGLDTTMFRLATQSQLERCELGHLVAAIAGGTAADARVGAPAEPDGDLDQPGDAWLLVLLCWLRHIAALVAKSERYARHPVWKRYNLHLVLDTLAHT